MKKIFYIVILIISIITFHSCEENTPEPTGIEFITFEKDTETFLLDEGSTFTTEIKVFTASKVSRDIVLELNVTTSLNNSNYSLPASVTIPANSNEGVLSLTITENNLDKINGETMSLSFTPPNDYFNGVTDLNIKINVFCPSNIQGNYKYSNGNGKFATIIEGNGINNFILSGDNAFGTNYFININDQCGSIKVTGGQLNDFGIQVSGTGTVLSNGNIELSYTADGYFSNRTMILVKQ